MSTFDQTSYTRPLRVLHVAFTMHARGTETWLLNIFRRTDRARVHMDFLGVEGEQGLYDDEIRASGGRVIPCTHPSNKMAFLKGFRRVLKEYGPYDVVHAHPYTLGGLIVREAARANVPVRIVHSHTDRRQVSADRCFPRNVYIWLMKRLINRYATTGVAASEAAALSLFGQQWTADPRYQVMYCGIDLGPFRDSHSGDLKNTLGINSAGPVIGHVGSFHDEKNHVFLLKIFQEFLKKNEEARLLLVGDGPCRAAIEAQILSMNLAGSVILTGVRQDVADLLGSMDLFVFPSLFEGLGLAVIEAQAAGLCCLVSDVLPREAYVVPGQVKFQSLEKEAAIWAQDIEQMLLQEKARPHVLSVIEKSDFNIEKNAHALACLYEQLVLKQENT